jgi:hypothetical protein
MQHLMNPHLSYTETGVFRKIAAGCARPEKGVVPGSCGEMALGGGGPGKQTAS